MKFLRKDTNTHKVAKDTKARFYAIKGFRFNLKFVLYLL